MEKRGQLKNVIELGLSLVRDVAERLSQDDRRRSGTYDRWSSKDGIAHAAEWLSVDLQRLEHGEEPFSLTSADEIDERNRGVFEKHASKRWEEVMQFAEDTFSAALRVTESMSEDELTRPRQFADGNTRTAWHMIASHALTHVVPHLTLICRRNGLDDLPEKMELRAADALLALDDGPAFVGTVKYNLACHFALAGQADRAISLLAEALEKNPALKAWARDDDDLISLREDSRFANLTGD